MNSLGKNIVLHHHDKLLIESKPALCTQPLLQRPNAMQEQNPDSRNIGFEISIFEAQGQQYGICRVMSTRDSRVAGLS